MQDFSINVQHNFQDSSVNQPNGNDFNNKLSNIDQVTNINLLNDAQVTTIN